ncbi:MAG: hypothetical protein ACI97P_002885, partial [Arcticibacterium sp.]
FKSKKNTPFTSQVSSIYARLRSVTNKEKLKETFIN